MSSMERQFIEEHSVIERYLQGKLAPDEQAAFEEAYLEDPALLEQLELAERFREGIIALDQSNDLPHPRGTSWRSAFTSPQYAAAASIALAVSLVVSGTLYRQNLALRDGTNMFSGAPSTRLEPLITVRGTSVNTITAPSQNEQIVLLVDPGFGDYDTYRVRVSRVTPAETVLELDQLQSGYEDYLAVAIPADLLSPGDFEVVVEGMRTDGGDTVFEESNRVALTVVAAAPP